MGEGRQPQFRARGRGAGRRPPSPDCRVVIEAGDLKRNAPLRALCERAANAAALPCYADGERDIQRLIDDEMREAGLTIAPDARAALVPLHRRRPAGLAQRSPQARALRARPRTRRARRRDRGGDRCFHAGARRARRCGLRRAAPARSKSSSPRPVPPAPRPAASSRRGCDRPACCTRPGSPSRTASPSPATLDTMVPPIHFSRKAAGRGRAQELDGGPAGARHDAIGRGIVRRRAAWRTWPARSRSACCCRSPSPPGARNDAR